MNVVRRSDGLLDANGLVELLALLRRQPMTASTAAEVMQTRGLGSSSRTHNSVEVLTELGLVDQMPSGFVGLRGEIDATPHDAIRRSVLDHYCNLLATTSIEGAFQLDSPGRHLVADRVLLPFRELGLPYLLVEFGIVFRTGDRAWTVAEDAASAFLAAIAKVNSRALSVRPLDPASLDAWLAARKAAGEFAEAFALTFERRRLDGHKFIEQVRWVSKEDAGAGFDMLSFGDGRSLILDRFIEVKGHGGGREFYWSTKEIAVARQKRDKYWLYLVDRSRIDQAGYEPEMISDPYAYFIEDNPSGWHSEPTSYKFTPPEVSP